MIINKLIEQIKRNFPYKPTLEQEKAINMIADFILSTRDKSSFILKGYAGTGKTSLMASLVKTMDNLEMKCILLAPTGRAAKVLANYSNHTSYTIHKKIYRQKSFSGEYDNFTLNDNLHSNTIFIVDESSMIANEGISGSMFGSGRLLDDMVQYIFNDKGCKLMLIGDTAQLPPVGEEESPSLSADFIRGYGIEVSEAELTDVVRQLHESGILYNATNLRKLIRNEEFDILPKLKIDFFPDIKSINGGDLIETISQSYSQSGVDETIIICRSNKRANIYNRGIRNTIFYREEELTSGDMLMIAKNNYYWCNDCKEIDFIANGDTAVVKRIRKSEEIYGFRFAQVLLSFHDYDDIEIEAKVLLDTLNSDSPALPKEMNDKLFYSILEDYADIRIKKERIKKMKEDVHYNALQIKYAYAITGHKAQGGQWENVFLDQGYMSDDYLTPDYFRWLYTAITRATKTLYLVNWPKEQIEE
jgi:exodeoxyribonuclease V